MNNFERAFAEVLKKEGGYVNDEDDAGGETYKGVARNRNPQWSGWIRIDILKKSRLFPENLDNDENLQDNIKEFYKLNYWHKVQGDKFESELVARSIFDFGINAGVGMSAKLAQHVSGATIDGVIGKKTLAKINAMDEELFLSSFALAKVARYVHICKRNPKNRKFFYGWIRRVLGES